MAGERGGVLAVEAGGVEVKALPVPEAGVTGSLFALLPPFIPPFPCGGHARLPGLSPGPKDVLTI